MQERGTSVGWLWATVLTLTMGAGLQASVTFDETDPALIAVSNDDYRFVFAKSNGSLLSVVDRSSGRELSSGSRGGCFWGASTPPASYVGGCSPGFTFSWAWDPGVPALTLLWRPADGASGLTARATVTPSAGNWLDMKLELSGSFSSRLDYILFPSDVLFSEAEVERVLLPILPGITLNRGFFEQKRSYTAKYPGEGMFSDFVAVALTSGSFSTYVLGAGRVHPSILGVVPDGPGGGHAYVSRAFAARLSPGSTWTSPTVRWRIGGSFLEDARAFRADSGIGALPSLRSRLGGYFETLIRAPFLKIDMEVMRRPFGDYATLIRELPVPSVLHWVGYGARGFDEDYPDFLPPHPAHGTTEEFAALFHQARAMGHVNMPYTNPTWWDDEGPTLRSLPGSLSVADISVLDDSGAARYETFGPKGGFAVSPWHPFVRQRADESVVEMTRDVPSDLLFQDQIGARPWIFDANPASPSPVAYIEGWVDHVARQGSVLLGTEQGFDALLPHEVAFFGSVPGEDDAWSDERFGPGNWEPWPFVPVVAGDKVLLYPHNMGANPPVDSTFRLNLAFGQMMMHTLHNPAADIFQPGQGGGLDDEAFRIVSTLQRRVIARLVTEGIDEFAWIAPKVSRTRFGPVEVIVNFDLRSSFDAGGAEVLPGGFIVRSDDGSLTAGVFERRGGIPLAPGRHWIVEEREAGRIRVAQPAGSDSPIVVAPLAGWDQGAPLEVRARDVRGDVIATVPSTWTPYGLLFRYETWIGQRMVDHYEIVDPAAPARRRGTRR
jgi:hypothetical protein